MANNSGPSRREAMRLKAEAEEARGRRNGRILWISLSLVAIAVVVILALVVSQALTTEAPSSEQQSPPNATEDFGIQLQSQGVEPEGDVPNLVIWEEFRCPACGERETAFGPAINQLVDEGQITAEVRSAHFFDVNDGTDNSERAAMAAAAADAVGKYREYHTAAYETLLSTGSGYTDQQLRVDLPAQVGIEGEDLTTFLELYDGRAFQDFVNNADDQFSRDGISGTPTFKVGDETLEFYNEQQELIIQPTAEDLLRAINEIAG
ncbi:MAG: DsbA family protein [Arachnia sp.]